MKSGGIVALGVGLVALRPLALCPFRCVGLVALRLLALRLAALRLLGLAAAAERPVALAAAAERTCASASGSRTGKRNLDICHPSHSGCDQTQRGCDPSRAVRRFARPPCERSQDRGLT